MCFEFIDAGERSLIYWNELRAGGCQALVLSYEVVCRGVSTRLPVLLADGCVFYDNCWFIVRLALPGCCLVLR